MIFVVTYVCVCHVYAGVSFCIQMKWVGYIVCSTFRYPSIGLYWSSVLTSIRIGTKCLLTYTRSCTIRYFYQIDEQNIYHTVWTVPQSKWKILERGKIDTPYTQIHDHSLSWFGPYFSFKWNDVFMEILPICV